jgi:hypothetical protein
MSSRPVGQNRFVYKRARRSDPSPAVAIESKKPGYKKSLSPI